MNSLIIKFRFLLFPLSLFYWGMIIWRNIYYNIGFFVTRKIHKPVISIGNIVIGGTGKTPAVIYFARKLTEAGVKVVVLSRGYGRKSTGTVIVSDGENKKASLQDSGDEPFLMARKLTGVPIVVDEVRYRGGLFAIKKFNPDIIILDDGFQHRSLYRDMDIVLLNSIDTPKDYKLFPYGNLREPFLHLKRSDFIIWTKTNFAQPPPTLRNKIFQMDIPQCRSYMRPGKEMKTKNGSMILFSEIADKRIYAFCGVADPLSFKKLLKEAGAELVRFNIFNDHHIYDTKELKGMQTEGKELNADIYLTTEKDFYKAIEVAPNDMAIYSVSVEFILPEKVEKRLLGKIYSKLKN